MLDSNYSTCGEDISTSSELLSSSYQNSSSSTSEPTSSISSSSSLSSSSSSSSSSSILTNVIPANERSVLFASHRINESIIVCKRIIMLMEGQVFIDGPVEHFLNLLYQYYQVDVIVNNNDCNDNIDHVDYVDDDNYSNINSIYHHHHHHHNHHRCIHRFIVLLRSINVNQEVIERIVIYSSELIRITFNRKLMSISKLWKSLIYWKNMNIIKKYSFRAMELEEVLATIISKAK